MTTILFISGGEIIIVVLVVLLLFGAKSIPDVARMLGKGMNEFRRASEEIKREFRENTSDISNVVEETKRELDKEVTEVRSAVEEDSAESDPYNLKETKTNEQQKDVGETDEIPPTEGDKPVSREDKIE